MTLMLVGPSLMEVWTTGGLFGLIENTPENYAEWVRCCCRAKSCCDILQNFATLKVTITCGQETVVLHPTGGSPNCEAGVGWDGEEQTFADFTMADFTFCCYEDDQGIPRYRVTASLSSSAPCNQTIDEEISQPAPCCPLDITFNVTPGECCSDMTIRVQTEDDIECP